MKRTLKIIILILLICSTFIIPVFADNVGGYEFTIETPSNTTEATNVAGSILSIVRWTAIAVGVIALTIIGIKYIFGSIEEKASYKKTMLPYVIGIALVMLATTLTTLLFNILENN